MSLQRLKKMAKRRCARVCIMSRLFVQLIHAYVSLLFMVHTLHPRQKRHCACVWMDLQMVGHVYHTTSVLIVLSCILRFIHGKNKGKTPLRMRVDGFADGGTHISTHTRAKTDHLYIRTKNKDKCHCACVWMDLQMVGHIYHTTSVLILLSCILRFIRGKNKDQTPLRMRVDGFADGGTHISTHNRAKTDHLYIRN